MRNNNYNDKRIYIQHSKYIEAGKIQWGVASGAGSFWLHRTTINAQNNECTYISDIRTNIQTNALNPTPLSVTTVRKNNNILSEFHLWFRSPLSIHEYHERAICSRLALVYFAYICTQYIYMYIYLYLYYCTYIKKNNKMIL